MEHMRKKHSFVASKKLYKSQFDKWGWQKNLPATHSSFMVHKAEKRRLEENKETIFEFGGRRWDYEKAYSSFMRNKKAQQHGTGQDNPTPAGVIYETPENCTVSPAGGPDQRGSLDCDVDVDMNDNDGSAVREYIQVSSDEFSDGEDIDPSRNDATEVTQQLRISSGGMTRVELLNTWEMAKGYKVEGKMKEAEDFLLQASKGFDEVMGPTHAETKRVKYERASFYAEQGLMQNADTILDCMTREHVQTWGHEHKRTQQHILHTIELLETWNRSADALGLLSRSKEVVESSNNRRHPGRRLSRRPATAQGRPEDGPDLQAISEEITQAGSPVKINYGIGLAKSHVKANDEASEGLLKAIIQHCVIHPQGLALQHLQALAELLDLYRRLGKDTICAPTFFGAEETMKTIFQGYDWDTDKFQHIELMEAAMQLAANLLKAGYKAISLRMFRTVSNKAQEVFASDDERMIWILITIGLAYQSITTWQDAEEWFEWAFAAALGSNKWAQEDGIVMALQNAMDKQHFTYLSDEGRPFKTIFGVSGISIHPGRLHLD
ncbi:hypothetical protein CEP54_002754 [Fusarium duplospermum]|uniref:Clr5 domain-containing protein n=1 Tax=Fusarium duplospermum TaxID=1325734 RepID=A0A428QU32_9HYPO|nr:hypothetical protein CEP54_002754 [Fusarium duplospermum]